MAKKPSAAGRTVDMASPRVAKPSAADRTINLFTGSTNVEAKEQSDVVEEVKEASPAIEDNKDRWLQKAIETQQYLSRKFADSTPEKDDWRLTKAGDMYTLEKMGLGADGKPFSWWAFQFHERSLFGLASAVVAAAKEKKGRE